MDGLSGQLGRTAAERLPRISVDACGGGHAHFGAPHTRQPADHSSDAIQWRSLMPFARGIDHVATVCQPAAMPNPATASGG